MANKSGVVSIGLNVDYQKSLQEMTKAFTSELTKLSNAAQKLKFSLFSLKKWDFFHF